tara:strand:+ start:846 stop:1298 length:453 start_codon:yes stop_codon:yes gene_type:complete
MSHEVTVNEFSVDVELDYAEILANIEDSIYERVTDQINEDAWGAVEYQVDEFVAEAIDSQDSSGISEALDEGIASLLLDYIRIKERGGESCGTGEQFEKAVRYAAERGVVDEALQVQKRLADLERKVSTILDALFVLGERASSVDDRNAG